VQFGLAIRPRWRMAASGFTSGTTAGTSGSGESVELSITIAPGGHGHSKPISLEDETAAEAKYQDRPD